jgi:hypothetical protein
MIININKSTTLTAIMFGVHAGALLLVVVIPIVFGLKVGLAALIGASLWWQSRFGVWASVCEIRLEEDGSCLRTFNGEQRRYRIARATAHAGFVRLMLTRAGERTCVQLVMCDAVEPETYRALRAQILQRRLPVPDQASA